MNSRLIVVRACHDILQHKQSLNSVLDRWQQQPGMHWLDDVDKRFIKQCVFGICRWYWQLETISQQLLKKPLKTKDFDVHLCLLFGLYQLLYLNVPDHAAVSATVDVTKLLKKVWAGRLINGCLRQFIRHKESILKPIEVNPLYISSHPQWMIDRFTQAWPEQADTIFSANNSRAPMTLRINLSKISRDDYLTQLNETLKLQAKPSPHSVLPAAIDLASPVNVEQLPGFAEGLVSVQDGASQAVASLVGITAGMRVLDACSAPGGKACHLLETHADIELTALDCDRARLQKVKDNLARLSLHANCLTADANTPTQWWDQQAFDVIMLDAPCSATGVIRRHPDIKCLRVEKDIDQCVATQQQLLSSLWPLLKPGGKLIYTTCSILPEENDQVIDAFLTATPQASSETLTLPFGFASKHGWQNLPSDGGADGFYYCVIA